jgi:hypothetical protein
MAHTVYDGMTCEHVGEGALYGFYSRENWGRDRWRDLLARGGASKTKFELFRSYGLIEKDF